MIEKLKNPILPGFYPDPSVCRVGEDYYLVCSSFELYPGIPIFHSKDLANWRQIGHAMNIKNGFHVRANVFGGGVMAPTIRYHEGIFYIICANFGDKGNFIVTAKNPAGPWSYPNWIDDIKDIDASLFFDRNGEVYIVYPSNVESNQENPFENERGIFIQDFDLAEMKPKGKKLLIYNSALRQAASPEAPHLYHVGDFYYLIIAEGGTEHYHAVTVARSKVLKEYFEGNPANPVLTHRHLGFGHPIDNVGHADLVQTVEGEWYAVFLASRTIGGYYKNLGRESYICPVIWDRQWPVFSPVSGIVEWEYPMPKGVTWTPLEPKKNRDDFDSEHLDLSWNFWGTPYEEFWKIKDSYLMLRCLKRSMAEPLQQLHIGKPDMSEDKCASLVAKRQTTIDFEAQCSMNFIPVEKEAAGLIIMQASNHHMRIEKQLANGKQMIQVVLTTTSMKCPPYIPGFTSETIETVLGIKEWDNPHCVMGIKASGQRYEFLIGKDDKNLETIAIGDGRLINPEIIGGMVGTMIGVFATGNGEDSDHYASFDWFEYR